MHFLKNMATIIEIDGSVLEGGGQILRLAVSFSSLLKKSIKVYKIRNNRKKPGLRPQHLTGIEMASKMCCGSLTGGMINSTEITFLPGELKASQLHFDPKTAASIVLLMQVAVPIALFAPSLTILRLNGGTNADMAPPIDYTMNVFIPLLKKFGGNCDCKLMRRGYYPKGGGEVEVRISPVSVLSPVNLTSFGSVKSVWGRSYVAGMLPIDMAYQMTSAANAVLKRVLPHVKLNITSIKESPQEALGNGSGIVIFAETDTGCILSGSAIGKRGISPHDIGTQAAEELAESIAGEYCVDYHSQDQIIVLMALAQGKSTVLSGPITEHTRTAIHIAEKLTEAKFDIQMNNGKFMLNCEGIGFKNKFW